MEQEHFSIRQDGALQFEFRGREERNTSDEETIDLVRLSICPDAFCLKVDLTCEEEFSGEVRGKVE